YIGGQGLALGYLNQEKLTAEQFISNPFEPNSRLYRSGDYGRYLRDGRIEYLGRIDDQVKLRGYRIELGEIESILRLVPEVQRAVVSIKKQNDDVKQLIAYLEVQKTINKNQIIDECQKICLQYLPGYMQPYNYLIFEHLPILQSGKIDRKKLLSFETTKKTCSDYIEPQTENEIKLAKIWRTLLNCDKVSRESNFFYLGGDSISCIQLVTHARQQGLDFTVKDIFDYPNLSHLSRIARPIQKEIKVGDLESKQASRWENEKRTIEKNVDQVTKTYPLSPLQEGLWFRSVYEKSSDVYFVQSVLELRGELRSDILKASWQSVIAAHDILRTAFFWVGLPRPMQYVKASVEIPWLEEDWSHLDNKEIDE
ncbi:AMP-binding protein, partial [Candidatus Dojkabacteria bacterium]|nr:AMP-binding protein [Candidatus Dojkabacteria bacterium]